MQGGGAADTSRRALAGWSAPPHATLPVRALPVCVTRGPVFRDSEHPASPRGEAAPSVITSQPRPLLSATHWGARDRVAQGPGSPLRGSPAPPGPPSPCSTSFLLDAAVRSDLTPLFRCLLSGSPLHVPSPGGHRCGCHRECVGMRMWVGLENGLGERLWDPTLLFASCVVVRKSLTLSVPHRAQL